MHFTNYIKRATEFQCKQNGKRGTEMQMQKYTIVNVIDLCVRDVTCIFRPSVYNYHGAVSAFSFSSPFVRRPSIHPVASGKYELAGTCNRYIFRLR